MKKLNLASSLVIVCAIVVIAFQYYWLHSLYSNEKALIQKTTNTLFKETIYEIQEKQTLQDTAFLTKTLQKVKAINASKIFEEAITSLNKNTTHNKKDAFSFLTNKLASYILEKADNQVKSQEIASISSSVKNSFQNIDSVELPIGEINGLFKNKLTSNDFQIDLPFTVYVNNKNVHQVLSNIYTDEVTIGIKNKRVYYASISDYHSYIFNKIFPQIIFSICLLIFFIGSLAFAYKTLIKQKQLVAAKNDLISNITHEFKTPITTISVAIEAITKFGVIDDKELTKEYLKVSTDELNRLNLLVDKVLKLSLFENGKTELKTEKINLNSLITDVITNMKPQLDKHNAVVNFDASKTIELNADKSHIKSVVYNLIDNAIKYCSNEPHIKVHLSIVENIVEITVEDNGIGIAPQHQQKIFDKFYRVPQGNRHNAKGYGLGLSYISHIVSLHNGYINVQSELNKGSKFTVGIKNIG